MIKGIEVEIHIQTKIKGADDDSADVFELCVVSTRNTLGVYENRTCYMDGESFYESRQHNWCVPYFIAMEDGPIAERIYRKNDYTLIVLDANKAHELYNC